MNAENPMQLSLLKPALDAICAFGLFALFISPVWGWLTDHNHALQSLAYLCTIVGGFWRATVWLRRYMRRREEQRTLAERTRRRWLN